MHWLARVVSALGRQSAKLTDMRPLSHSFHSGRHHEQIDVFLGKPHTVAFWIVREVVNHLDLAYVNSIFVRDHALPTVWTCGNDDGVSGCFAVCRFLWHCAHGLPHDADALLKLDSRIETLQRFVAYFEDKERKTTGRRTKDKVYEGEKEKEGEREKERWTTADSGRDTTNDLTGSERESNNRNRVSNDSTAKSERESNNRNRAERESNNRNRASNDSTAKSERESNRNRAERESNNITSSANDIISSSNDITSSSKNVPPTTSNNVPPTTSNRISNDTTAESTIDDTSVRKSDHYTIDDTSVRKSDYYTIDDTPVRKSDYYTIDDTPVRKSDYYTLNQLPNRCVQFVSSSSSSSPSRNVQSSSPPPPSTFLADLAHVDAFLAQVNRHMVREMAAQLHLDSRAHTLDEVCLVGAMRYVRDRRLWTPQSKRSYSHLDGWLWHNMHDDEA